MDDANRIKADILDFILDSERKVSPAELKKRFSRRFIDKDRGMKCAVKELVDSEKLSYTYRYGQTFLEKSFNTAVSVSARVTLKPPNRQYVSGSDEIVVNIMRGAAFGSGEHPSTRLAVRGIEHVMDKIESDGRKPLASCLDIGTGSGILAIVAVLMGVDKGIGIDIDPNAIAEATENVKLNWLEDRIRIQSRLPESMTGPFPLIIANLRYPTLIRLHFILGRLLEDSGYMVFSGIKQEESKNITNSYNVYPFELVRREQEKEWVGMVIKKKGQPI